MKKKIGKSQTVGRLSVVFAICVTMLTASAITAVGATLRFNNQTLYPGNVMSYSFEFTQPGLQTTSRNGATYTALSDRKSVV